MDSFSHWRNRDRLWKLAGGIAVAAVVVVLAAVAFPTSRKAPAGSGVQASAAVGPSAVMGSTDLRFLVRLSDLAQAYCKNPSAQPPSNVNAGVNQLIVLYRKRPNMISSGPQFANEPLRQILGDFAGLFRNKRCAATLGDKIARVLASRAQADGSASTGNAHILDPAEQAFLVQLNNDALGYCKKPSSGPPSKLQAEINQLIALYRNQPNIDAPGPQFAHESVAQIVADFAGLFNKNNCATRIGDQLGGVIKKA